MKIFSDSYNNNYNMVWIKTYYYDRMKKLLTILIDFVIKEIQKENL